MLEDCSDGYCSVSDFIASLRNHPNAREAKETCVWLLSSSIFMTEMEINYISSWLWRNSNGS